MKLQMSSFVGPRQSCDVIYSSVNKPIVRGIDVWGIVLEERSCPHILPSIVRGGKSCPHIFPSIQRIRVTWAILQTRLVQAIISSKESEILLINIPQLCMMGFAEEISYDAQNKKWFSGFIEVIHGTLSLFIRIRSNIRIKLTRRLSTTRNTRHFLS